MLKITDYHYNNLNSYQKLKNVCFAKYPSYFRITNNKLDEV